MDSGYLLEAGPLSELVLVELRYACSQLYNWSRIYQERALKGEISMRQSVNNYLSDQGLDFDSQNIQ